MRLHAFAASETGPAHLNENISNQDHVSLRGHRRGWIAAASDGLGSHQYSDKGSYSACLAVQQHWRNHYSESLGIGSGGEHHALIHQQWLGNISPYPVNQSGATCLYANATSKGEVRAGQLGDGLILYRQNGEVKQLTPEREGFGNQTQALGKTFNDKHWFHADFCLEKPGDGIVLMTDGIADDLLPETLSDFLEVLYQESRNSNRRRVQKWLKREFNHWATPFHGDDKSLVAIFKGS